MLHVTLQRQGHFFCIFLNCLTSRTVFPFPSTSTVQINKIFACRSIEIEVNSIFQSCSFFCRKLLVACASFSTLSSPLDRPVERFRPTIRFIAIHLLRLDIAFGSNDCFAFNSIANLNQFKPTTLIRIRFRSNISLLEFENVFTRTTQRIVEGKPLVLPVFSDQLIEPTDLNHKLVCIRVRCSICFAFKYPFIYFASPEPTRPTRSH